MKTIGNKVLEEFLEEVREKAEDHGSLLEQFERSSVHFCFRPKRMRRSEK